MAEQQRDAAVAKAVAVIMQHGIPDNNANGALYSKVTHDLICVLLNQAQILHSSITAGQGVPWVRAFEQLLQLRQTLDALEREMIAAVTREDRCD